MAQSLRGRWMGWDRSTKGLNPAGSPPGAGRDEGREAGRDAGMGHCVLLPPPPPASSPASPGHFAPSSGKVGAGTVGTAGQGEGQPATPPA